MNMHQRLSSTDEKTETEHMRHITMQSITTHLKTRVTRYLSGRNGTGVNVVAKHAVLRPISTLLIASVLTLSASPLVHAMQARSKLGAQQTQGDAAQHYMTLVQGLKADHEIAGRQSRVFNGKRAAAQGVIAQAEASVAAGLKALGLGANTGPYSDVIEQLAAMHNALQQENASLVKRWQASGIAAEIIDKQTEISQQVALNHQQLSTKLKAANNAPPNQTDSGTAQQALATFLQTEVGTAKHNPLNLKSLPWQANLVNPSTLRQPFGDSVAFKQYLAARAQKSLAVHPVGGVKALTASGTKALAVTTTPTAADLAETGDAPHTAAIKALAQSLSYQPVAIYQWVHDNIAFTPTYGSVQGAEDTLNKRSGNAFDQASLTIALLRACGVPARYVVGTIEVPEAKLRNWLGDFKTIDAAQQILGQGGIPNVAMVSGGRITSVRLEHAWVETYVSFYPSRGAKHTGNPTDRSYPPTLGTQGDAWVPLDPSYKQYNFNAGMNLKSEVAFDAQGFIDAAKQGATVNEAEGSVQNLNQTNIKAKLDAYQQSIKTRLDQTPAATVGDVLGTQTILKDPLPYFAGSLQTEIKAIGERYSRLPNSLRAQFRYSLAADDYARSLESYDFQFQAATSELAGKKITLAWVPATDADRRAIEALLPAPNADGTPIRPEQLPQGLPASISLKAELRVEGEVKAISGAYRAGAEPVGAGAFTRYGSSGTDPADWDETTDGLVAGQQTALGISVQGISKTQLDTLKTRMEQTKGKLEQIQQNPNNTTALNGLTGDTITGDILTANIWSWFADLQGHGKIASSQATITTANGTSGLYDRPGLQYGLFHANAQPNKLAGIVTTGISFKGVLMDIGHVRHLRWVKDTAAETSNTSPTANADAAANAKKRWIGYNRMRGQYASALEHAIPERFFNDTTKCNAPGASSTTTPPFDANKPACAEGISAVKAIAIAQSQGQKIFVINSVNADQAIPLLAHRASVIDEVSASVAAGKEVTIHQSAITANGWTGAGYTVIDPETGAGAYLIEGGARGGWYSLVANGAAALAFIALLAGKLVLVGLIPAMGIAGVFYAVILGALALTAVLIAIYEGGYDPTCGGISTCDTADVILKIATAAVALVLLSVGLGGSLLALALAIILLRALARG